MAASHFLPSGPNSATPIRRRIGARIRTGRNARPPASSSSPSAVPSASLHTPPLLSQAVRRNAHMTPIRRSCPVSLRRPARVRSKELAGSDRVGPLYRLFRSAFGSGSAHSPRLYAAGGHTARMRRRSRSARRSSFLSSPFVVRFRKFRKFRLSFALICVNSFSPVKKSVLFGRFEPRRCCTSIQNRRWGSSPAAFLLIYPSDRQFCYSLFRFSPKSCPDLTRVLIRK